jgi:16S rRNA (uracil1498-N3)-methyltransferase
MTLPRFLLPDASLANDVLVLPRAAAHHVSKVLRLSPGALVRVFDGKGREFEATIESSHARQVPVRITREIAPRPESPLHLVLALPSPKADRMDWVLQKCTELGVAEFWPITSARSEPCARGAASPARLERWLRILAAATEQCGRASLPTIEPLTDVRVLLDRPFAGVRFIATTECEPQTRWPDLPLGQARVLLLVGPAGGWEPAEVERALLAGAHPVPLGPRILRSDTAAVAATTVAQFVWGDLGRA